MKTFTDNTGRAWTLAINVGSIKRVKALTQVDLLEAVEGKLIERLASDPVLLCDVVYALCQPQADAQNVSDEDFGRSMAGDAIDSATTAMLEELVDFFPSRRRALLAKAVGKFKALEQTVLTAVEERLDALDVNEMLKRAMDAEATATIAVTPLVLAPRAAPTLRPIVATPPRPGGPSGNSPVSSGVTPIR